MSLPWYASWFFKYLSTASGLTEWVWISMILSFFPSWSEWLLCCCSTFLSKNPPRNLFDKADDEWMCLTTALLKTLADTFEMLDPNIFWQKVKTSLQSVLRLKDHKDVALQWSLSWWMFWAFLLGIRTTCRKCHNALHNEILRRVLNASSKRDMHSSISQRTSGKLMFSRTRLRSGNFMSHVALKIVTCWHTISSVITPHISSLSSHAGAGARIAELFSRVLAVLMTCFWWNRKKIWKCFFSYFYSLTPHWPKQHRPGAGLPVQKVK